MLIFVRFKRLYELLIVTVTREIRGKSIFKIDFDIVFEFEIYHRNEYYQFREGEMICPTPLVVS